MKRSRLQRLLDDPSGYLGWYISEKVLTALGQMASTFWCRLSARLWGIRLGRGVRFRGLARFKRYPESRISIGDGSIFLSSLTSNPLGITRPCMLTTWYSPAARITIGRNCGFSGVTIASFCSITIGDNVLIGPQSIIMDTDGHGDRNRKQLSGQPVVIGDNVWIGMNCTILKGVTIGDNAVVAAGAVVTRSVPANTIVAGNPAVVVRELP